MGFEPQVNTILDAMPQSSLKSENEEEAERQEREFASGVRKYPPFHCLCCTSLLITQDTELLLCIQPQCL